MARNEWTYPQGWPSCPKCGDPALDGHVTCGRFECDEHGTRRGIDADYQAAISESAAYPCKGCGKRIRVAELCDQCADDNDPFPAASKRRSR